VVVPPLEAMSTLSDSLHEDEVDNRTEWDDDVEDGIREANDEAVNEATDVMIIDEHVEGENIDDI
jgi:hypothetical protein